MASAVLGNPVLTSEPRLTAACAQVYPNHCSAVYPGTSHVVRATFSGGVTSDGVASVLPSNRNVFILSR